ncbi:MAG TPA: TonB-dependent receptor [Gemmatimonadales bacterium]|nr:TonB-dependent receptor [Gemmatimonadales bacterium]
MNVMLLVLTLAAQQPQDTVVLKPIVVTGTRVPVPLDNVSSAVTVLRGEDLITRGIRTVADALQLVPAASIVESGSFGGQTSLFMRGGESDYVKVLLDGVPLNQPGGSIDLAHLTTDNVERIEILRGPASVLYGSDAMTGVVQIFTKRGATNHTLGAELRAGTYGSTDAALDLAGQTIGGASKLTYSARASRFATNGLYDYNNDYRNTVISAGMDFAPDARSTIGLTYRYADDLYHFPTDGGGAPVDSNQRTAERGPVLGLSANRIMGAFELRISAAGKEARLFYNDEPDSPADSATFSSNDYVRRASASALLDWRPRATINVTAGLEYEDERQQGTSEFSPGPGAVFRNAFEVQRHNTGYLAQSLFSAGRAAITVGARLDDNSQFGTHATYRAGLVFRVRERTRFRFSTGTGFKEPTFFENLGRGSVTGNPYLDPERSQSWEFGVEQGLAGNRGSIAVIYFNQRFRDLIEFNPAPPVGQPNYFNVGAATANGVEATVAANLSPTLVFSVHYTYLHTRVDESGSPSVGLFVPGEALIRRPDHTVAPELAATVGRAHMTLGARWVGRRADIDFSQPLGPARVELDPYTRVNFAIQYDLGRFMLSGRVQNLFDDQTEEVAGYRPRGRTVLIGGRFALAL